MQVGETMVDSLAAQTNRLIEYPISMVMVEFDDLESNKVKASTCPHPGSKYQRDPLEPLES